ncbi:MAG: aldose 1-epimerase family protein [Saprospiraceae bacterium]|nr:aldose 1-epimerase family protein [Saprospiraceae bacterium]
MNTYIIQNEYLQIGLKQKGGELFSIQSKANQQEYMWEADPAYWGRHSCILFPIVGKVWNDTYRIDGQSFTMTQHGFLRDLDFEVIAQSEDAIIFQYEITEALASQYPYSCLIRITYTVIANTLSVVYAVENLEGQEIYFSIGAHPGFRCPLLPNEKRADYKLVFNQAETAVRYLIENGYQTGATEPVLENTTTIAITDHLFDNDALIFKHLQSNKVTLVNNQETPILTFHFPNTPFLGIWSKSPDSPFVCIEPWYGIADKLHADWDYKDKEGVVALEADGIFSFEHRIEIHFKGQ